MNKISKGLVALAASTSIALAGTSVASAQSSLPNQGPAPAPINVEIGPWPDYAKMSSDANKNARKGQDDVIDASSNATGADRDDATMLIGVGVAAGIIALGAAAYFGLSQVGVVPKVNINAIAPGIKLPELPQLPQLPNPAQLSS